MAAKHRRAVVTPYSLPVRLDSMVQTECRRCGGQDFVIRMGSNKNMKISLVSSSPIKYIPFCQAEV